MIYAVILMDGNQTVDLAPRFAKIGAKVYKWRRQVYPVPLTHVYFASYKGTTNELSDKLGFDQEKDKIDGVVIPLNDYAGYGDNDLWQWLKAQGNE